MYVCILDYYREKKTEREKERNREKGMGRGIGREKGKKKLPVLFWRKKIFDFEALIGINVFRMYCFILCMQNKSHVKYTSFQ